ncbi:putative tetratricopeptide TPR_2 repeat protein [Treponema primitia ZAS-2]|uniref:Putative tetratricopeptide TPR_2 repeat protein n=1 Tax=Treponema primitia (strain ATCC BAA-887 / DSM 12427 / ZAS-2) TaxID=545694 RepID=F5YLR2_TREPZ|nr:hypothetical protein [Treponema primitia]AEF86907.1 putative tetratricopeptide TPR_2 repeat protein [Treponema primitia ZAS-2]
MKKRNSPVLFALLFFLPILSIHAEQGLEFRLAPGGAFPLSENRFEPGFGLSAALDWTFLPLGRLFKTGPLQDRLNAGLSGQGGLGSLGVKDGSSLSLLDLGLGPLVRLDLGERFSLEITGNLGIYQLSYDQLKQSALRWGGTLSGAFRLAPYLSVFLNGGYHRYEYNREPLAQTLSIGAGLSINLLELIRPQTRIKAEKTLDNPVFPVSFAWYEDNPLATVRVTNNERNTLRDLRLSFFLEQYMNEPFLLPGIPQLKPGESVDIPVTALFNGTMLDLEENTNANARIILSYRNLGSRREADFPLEIPVYHRNAMNWDDDRRAASFVSPRDSAAQLFARYTASVVDRRLRPDTPRNIQYALGLLAALQEYGIHYIIDPSSSYLELSENASALDNLNYPYQTLLYHGGDCDDLSILFCSLLEVLRVDTAFITIPGHIYAAFDTGLEAPAEDQESDGGFIVYDDRLWMPVEITIPEKGLYRAWQTGIEQWRSAGEEGKFYPMGDSWAVYPPVSVGEAGRDPPALPGEDALIGAFEKEMEGNFSKKTGK